jgi:lysyl-tRNA synthetase class 2
LREARRFFDERGFLEVQTPVLSRDTVIDRHLEPWVVERSELKHWGFAEPRAYLQTSPEFAMKRLLASGMDKIYQLGPVFRGGERGPLHNPEFTMLEWYHVGECYSEGMQFLIDLVKTLLPDSQLGKAGESRSMTYTYQDICWQQLGIDILQADRDQLAQLACERKLVSSLDWSDDWDDWCNLLFTELVQPVLGNDVPTVICDFPASQSALARISERDERVAERFEIFYRGVELANGYHELLDPAELRRRNRQINQQRLRDGKISLPEESRLLEAMERGMPSSVGCALGFDRLVMLACRATTLDEVLPFPIERA